MGNKITFIAPFPDNHNIKDGMIQRVKAIDDIFSESERIYLSLSFNHFFRKSTIQPNIKIQVLKRNVFFHFIEIFNQLRRSDIIYCHSIYNILPIIFFLFFLKGKIILDIHGVVTNELSLEKKYFKSFIYKLIEKFSFKKIDIAIGVTNSMCNYFKKKYPDYKGKFIVFNIFPESLKKCFGEQIIPHSKTIIIYSGNTQKWQNIDLMMQTIKNNQYANIQYIILSSEVAKFENLITKYDITPHNILIKSVLPKELDQYYSVASYGFILRDESIINQVANPTKLIEYLTYGIIPIVLNENIGDYKSYNYEFIYYNLISNKLTSQKSIRNKDIAYQLLKLNQEMDLRNFIMG